MDIPTLGVTLNNENITVEKGCYSWSEGGESVTTDASSPDQIADKMEGNKIKPNSELALNFSKIPSIVRVVDWSESKNNSFAFDNDKILVPNDNGIYIYEIIGEWEDGQGSFTIKLIVSDE